MSPSSLGAWHIVGALQYLLSKFLHYPFKSSFETHNGVVCRNWEVRTDCIDVLTNCRSHLFSHLIKIY